jgi:predicted nucleic acid-binding protein
MQRTYLLDTNIVIYYIGGETVTCEKLAPIMRSDSTIILPSIVITELWSGKKTPSAEIHAIEDFIATLLMMPLDMQIAKSAGMIRRGYNLSIGDSIIAATSLATGATLLTRNVRDFKKVPNLILEAI